MTQEVMEFLLICKCGETLEGYFSHDDERERLFCSCGLVWTISRPVLGEE